jgi:hypothetical protein
MHLFFSVFTLLKATKTDGAGEQRSSFSRRNFDGLTRVVLARRRWSVGGTIYSLR